MGTPREADSIGGREADMLQLIILTILTGVGGLFLGAVLGIGIGGRSRQSEAILLNFSAGAMISLVCFELLHEAIETEVGIWIVTAAVLVGAAAVAALDYIADRRSGHSQDFIACEDCDEEFEHDAEHAHCEHEEEHEVQAHHHKRASHMQLFIAGMVMAAAVAIHNIPEGMSIGAIYVSGDGAVSGALLMLLLSIIMHNIPEGMAISVPLITGGMSRIRACAVAALSGVPTVLGALLGYAVGDMGALGLALSLSFASGTLLYVVFGEVMPQAINLYCSRKTAFAAIAGVAAGMLILSSHIH